MDTEPVSCDSEYNGVYRNWESDEGSQFVNGLEPQDEIDSSPLPGSSSPLSSSRISFSATNPPLPIKKTKAVSNIRKQLRDCLDNVHDGTFATWGALSNAANPAIFVSSLGVVGLPISDRDAEAIFDIVHKNWSQADHPGCIVSPRAGSCELDPNQFEIRNPAWQQTLTEAVEKSAKALGYQTNSVRAEIAKLKIYRPDGTVDDQQQ